MAEPTTQGRPSDEPSIAIIDGSTGYSSGRCAALTTALACNTAGLTDVTLYTADVAEGAVPAESALHSVDLSPNASRILRSVQVLENIRAAASEPQFIHQRSHRSGFQLATIALGAMAEGRYNAPFIQASLQQVCGYLADAVTERGVLHKQFNHAARLSQNQKRATLHFGDTQHSHDVVIIANDPEQTLRKACGAQPLQAEETPWQWWTGRVAQADLPQGAFGPVITQWLGPDSHVRYHLHTKNTDHQELQFSIVSTRESVAQALAGWHPSLTAMVDAAHCFDQQRVLQGASPDTLVHGRFLFLATSAHHLLPQLPQQTALGIEDAWVLARMLDQWQDEPENALPDYERYRLPRARRLASQARAMALEYSTATGTTRWARDLKLTFGSRFLPELAMQKNDWLYGYDAVNGFE